MKLTAALLCMIQLALATPQHQSQLPPPPSQLPPPPLSSHPAPITPTLPPVPLPPTTTSKGAPPPPSNGPQPNGPICECGYTYCSSVLMAMKVPWSQTQLAEAYCKTPSAACTNNSPATNVTSALYLCLCDDIDQEVGNQLHLICGCDKCLNVGPDFRGRCETPCHAGSCSE